MFYYYIRLVLNIDKSIKQGKQDDIILRVKITSSNNLHIRSLVFGFLHSLSRNISYSSNELMLNIHEV